MNYLLEIGLTNAALVTLLALGVWLVTRIWRQPVFVHALWVVVLLKLITPPVVGVPWRWSQPPTNATANAESVSSPAAQQLDAPVLPTHKFETEDHAALPVAGPQTIAMTRTELQSEPAGPPTEDHEAAESMKSIPWITLVAASWIAGSVIFLVVTAARLLRFHRALADAAPASDELCNSADEVAARFGIAGGYRLRVTEGRLPPLVWPIGRPTIVLSRQLLTELSPEETQTLLAHEFAHLRRRDHWVRWLELVAVTIYWWHPVAWWARTMIRRTEEQACDAWVAWAFPDAARQYASALFTAIEFVSSSRPCAPLIASRLDSGGQLKERIETVMSGKCCRRLSPVGRLSVLILALLVLPISLRRIHAQDEPSTSTKNSIETIDLPSENPAVDQAVAQPLSKRPTGSDDVAAEKIRPGMLLVIRVSGALPDEPIADAFVVEPAGTVALGPSYGRVQFGGLTIPEAEAALMRHLQEKFKDPKVQITMADQQLERRRVQVPADPYRISPGDLLKVIVTGANIEEPIADTFLVEPGGTIPLGPSYGRVKVAGMTLEQAETATYDLFHKWFADPRVQITLGGWEQSGRPASPFYHSSLNEVTTSRPIQTDGEATSEELDVLREHVAFLEQRFMSIDAKNQSGSRGGSQDVRDMTGYEMATAKFQLALAAGRRDEAEAHLKDAEKFAESGLQAAKANYEAGRITNDMVLKAANNLAESKRRLLRFGESLVSVAGPSPQAINSDSKPRREPPQSTQTSESGPSIGVVAKLVEGRKQYYERMRSLAQKNLVSVDELEKAKNDYEIQRAGLEQAKRALKYNQLLVELAETEYQEAVAKNESKPNSVSEFELRKLRIKVELAKAKLSELAE